jgi:rhodanese-related sulfurtransferase
MFKRPFLLALLLSIVVPLSAQEGGTATTLQLEEFKAGLARTKGLLLDVRTPEECAEGIIEGAMILDYSAPGFMEGLGKLDRERPVFIYCAAGGRSRQTMTRMQRMGFREVHDLEGGMTAWREAGQPVVVTGSGSKR